MVVESVGPAGESEQSGDIGGELKGELLVLEREAKGEGGDGGKRGKGGGTRGEGLNGLEQEGGRKPATLTSARQD